MHRSTGSSIGELKQPLLFHRTQVAIKELGQNKNHGKKALQSCIFCQCDKTQDLTKATYRGPCSLFGPYNSRGLRIHQQHSGEQLSAHITSHKRKPRKCTGDGRRPWKPQDHPSDTPSLTRLHFLILPKQPPTQFSNAQDFVSGKSSHRTTTGLFILHKNAVRKDYSFVSDRMISFA